FVMARHVGRIDLDSPQERRDGAVVIAEGEMAEAKRLIIVARRMRLEQHGGLDSSKRLCPVARCGENEREKQFRLGGIWIQRTRARRFSDGGFTVLQIKPTLS